jgi:hypothetical protein
MLSPNKEETPSLLKENIKTLRKENRKLGRSAVDKNLQKGKKEKMILSLFNECDYLENEILLKQVSFKSISELRKQSETNHIEIQNYCQSIREELKDFVEQVETFESEIEDLKKRRQQIIKTSEAVIAQKQAEHTKLEEQLFKIDYRIEKQIDDINKVKITYNENVQDKENQFQKYTKEENKAIDKHSSLLSKFNELRQKYNLYKEHTKQFQTNNDKENDNDNNETSTKKEEKINKNEYDIQITEARIRKELLEEELNSITLRIRKLQYEKERMEIAKRKTNAISITSINNTSGLLDSYYNKTMMLNYNKQNKTLKESTMMTSYRNTLSMSNTITRKKY